MLNILNNVTLILGYSCYVVIAYIAFVLACIRIEKAIKRKKKAKALKERKKRFMEVLKSA